MQRATGAGPVTGPHLEGPELCACPDHLSGVPEVLLSGPRRGRAASQRALLAVRGCHLGGDRIW